MSRSIFAAVLVSGGCSDSPGDRDDLIQASINTEVHCHTPVNLQSRRAYAERADAMFLKPSIRAGGHDDDMEIELGVNVVVPSEEELVEGIYPIENNVTASANAYVYYIPDAGDLSSQYISIANQGSLDVTRLILEDDGSGFMEVVEFSAEFSNVIMFNHSNQDSICIDNFKISVINAN